ncbi:MAG: aminotransferase class V-fold PLP-dependent enzyme [Blastocatellia bacterium]
METTSWPTHWLDRRQFVGTLLTAAGTGAVLDAPATSVISGEANLNVYERIGVQPLVNAAGILTMLGGSLMLKEVKAAMEEASRHYVNLRELHEAAGALIARRIGVEAALVTSGAAAALLIGTAACVTKGDPERIRRIPDTSGMPNEVIVQRAHRHHFDHAIRSAGVRFVEVETREELDKAFSSKTAMMHFLVYADKKGRIGMEEWIDIGKKRGIPNFLDAAADIPPAGNLRKYTDMGFDLVAFSGGKALRGPQCSGLLLGRKDLVEAAFLNDSPFPDSIGRGCKVGKEEIIGLLTAVELFLKRDHAADWKRWQAIIADWEAELHKVRGITLERIGPENAGNVPYLSLNWDQSARGFSHEDFLNRLREGRPRIELWDTRDRGLCLTPFMLEPGEEKIVIRRVVEVFKSFS